MTMIKNREAIEKKVRCGVSRYLAENFVTTGVPMHFMIDEESKEHIINIGTSIMMNRLGVNTYPGSFVQAVLDNDLHGAFSRADHINSQVMKFYVTMMYNLGIDVQIETEVEGD
jgi:hypothetical protein